jgi:iron complex outermembrane recepter protein
MPKGHCKDLSLVALGCVAALAGSAVRAQARVTEDQDAPVLDVVMVTAERRSQDLQTTAISASVLDAATLEARNVIGLTTLQYAAPGLLISDYSSANTFNIRGIGQSQVDIDLPSGVVIYRDGVPTLTGYFQNAPYYDMAGVEVLRGPQGTFVGKSAAAGAVFIRTRDPELKEFDGDASVGVGSDGFYEGTVVLNAPLSDTWAIRFATHEEVRQGLFDQITSNPLPGGTNAGGPWTGDDNRRLFSGRLGVLWEPSEQFRAVFKLDGDHLHFGSHAVTGLDPVTGVELDLRHPIVNGHHIYVDKGVRSSLNLGYELGEGFRLNSLTGFSTVESRADWDLNAANPAPLGFRTGGQFTNYSQELNLLSPDDQPIRYVAGLFWQRYLNDVPSFPEPGFAFFNDNSNGPLLTTPWEKDERNYAGFGQIELGPSEALQVQLGARWSHYEFEQFTQLVLFAGVLDLPFNEPAGGVRQKLSEDSVDWKVNVNYELTDDHFVYGLVSRGHSPGSINITGNPETPLTGRHTSYKKMQVINYEAGWKADFIDSRLKTQLAAYYQMFDDYQAGFARTGVGLPQIETIVEIKNANTTSKIYGIELAAQGRFENLSLDLGAAWSKSELGSFGTIVDIFAPVFGGSPSVNLDGARTPFSPEWTLNGGAAYTFCLENVHSGLTVTPRLDASYRSESYSSLFRNRATLLQGVTVLNASIRLDSDPWWASLWVTNLTDREYVAAKQNVTGINGVVEGLVYAAPPRLFGVRFGRSF